MMKTSLIILISLVSVSLFSPSMTAQSPTGVNRSSTFLLGNEHFDLSGQWKAVFCRSDNERICVLADIAVEESENSREQLPDGRMKAIFVYRSRPEYRVSMFVKGLKSAAGSVSNVLSSHIELSSEPSSVSWAADTYQFRLDRFNLLIEKLDSNNVKQSVPLFIDPDKRCKDMIESNIRRNVMLRFMGDIDRDQKPDFIIDASAYRSCATTITRIDPLVILILSSEAEDGQLGRIVQSVISATSE
jgi:hypothetical protein